MNKKRLLKLADLLEADAKNKKGIKFDLNYFVMPGQHMEPTLDCKTSACAVGLACLSPEFQKEGLAWVPGASGKELVPTFGRNVGENAANEFFGIGAKDFRFLFMPYSYEVERGAKAERVVAKRIRDFVSGSARP